VASEHRVARKFEGQVRHHRDQISIAAALADAIHRTLHLDRPCGHRGERVGYGEVAVVVAVDRQGTFAPCCLQRRSCLTENPGDFAGQRAAVGVAADDPRGSRPGGGHDRLGGVVGIQLPAIEEVFGVVKNLAAGLGEVAHRVGDHGEVFLARDAEHLADVKGRCLAHDRHDRRIGVEQGLHARIGGGRHAAAPRHPKRAHPRVPEVQPPHPLEILRVLRVREWVAALDEVDARLVEPAGDRQLVFQGKVDPFPLAAVAKRGVVDFDRTHGASLVGIGLG